MPSPAEKWNNSKDAIAEAVEGSGVELRAVPLGGEGEDVPVDVEAEFAERRELRKQKRLDKARTNADLQRIRAEVTMDALDDLKEGPVKHHKQWLEGAHPSNPIKEPAEKMRSTRWVENQDGPLTKLFKKLTGRG